MDIQVLCEPMSEELKESRLSEALRSMVSEDSSMRIAECTSKTAVEPPEERRENWNLTEDQILIRFKYYDLPWEAIGDQMSRTAASCRARFYDGIPEQIKCETQEQILNHFAMAYKRFVMHP